MNIVTKTICTIGPSSEKEEILEQFVTTGMSIARFNFSHAKQHQFIKQKQLILQYAKAHNRQVKILMDLQGPRMRVGEMPDNGLELKEGNTQVFSTDLGNTNAIYINDRYLHEAIEVGHPIFLANGDMELLVQKVEGNTITTTVVRGGILHSRKGVNVPETNVKTPSLTEKDLTDIAFGLEQGIDYVALSFVKNADDIHMLRSQLGDKNIKIVAKIELKIALDHIDDIIKASDVIMIARGDLGIELPLETIPLIQKDLVKRCRAFGKPAIVATQMLMSMVNHHRPTRAEVSDVANAVLDGAWACMLSDETAFGNYPVESLQYLVKTIKSVENHQMSVFGNPSVCEQLIP